MKRPSRGACVFILLLILAFSPTAGEAAAKKFVLTLDPDQPQKISLIAGRSQVIECPGAVKRVSLAASAFADAMMLSPRQLYLTGKAPGMTNLTLWQGDTVLAAYDVEVSPDIVRLKEKLHEILPQEENILVSSLHDSITLAGTVSNAANHAQALALAAPFGKVTDLLEVGGVQQVMLEVRISEVQKSLMRQLGINFNGVSADGSKFGASLLGGLATVKTQPPLAFPIGSSDISAPGGMGVTSSVNALFRFIHDGSTWTGFIDALKDNGLLTVLAEPTLTALSGQTASFNAGGEIPIPESAGLGSVSVKYKKFGVGLSFTPTVLGNDKISMKVAPRVSDIDFSNAVMASGFLIPAFSEREVSTVIELADGQSFALAGLLSEKVTENISKFPVLGDIPILGALFRSSAFKKNETELLVIVTPHLVKPLDMSKQTLPTDKYSDPGDFSFYLLGNLASKPEARSSAVPLGMQGFDGEVGHIMTQ
jgi:pilus assembly protein CpaC